MHHKSMAIVVYSNTEAVSCYGQLWTRIPAQKPRARAAGRAPCTSGSHRWNKEDVDEAVLIQSTWRRWRSSRRRRRRWQWRREVQSITYRTEHHLGFLPLSLWLLNRDDVTPRRGRGLSAVTVVIDNLCWLIKGTTSQQEGDVKIQTCDIVFLMWSTVMSVT